MATVRGLLGTQREDPAEPLPRSAHRGFRADAAGRDDFFDDQLGPCVQSDPRRSRGYSEDCNHNIIRHVRISVHVVRLTQRGTDVSAFHRRATSGLDFCFTYTDDILVASLSEEGHLQHFKTLYERLKSYGVVVNPVKCTFDKLELKFLGYLVSSESTRPLPDKVKAIRSYPQPQTAKQLRQFLGMFNFYSWITRFGTPLQVTTDQGRQFKPPLFKKLAILTGTTNLRKTAYHPAANGMVKRLHRQLKAAIKCHQNSRWTEVLCTVLLGVRATFRKD